MSLRRNKYEVVRQASDLTDDKIKNVIPSFFSKYNFTIILIIIIIILVISIIVITTTTPGVTTGDAEIDASIKILKGLLNETDYVKFVTLLRENIKDKKFIRAIRKLSANSSNQIKYNENLNLSVKNMIPTQNEIDVEKSLLYPLTDAFLIHQCFSNSAVALGCAKVVTSCEGKYIIDGHHRWSQVFVVNPDCLYQCLDLTELCEPFDALKAAEIGIAGDLENVPMAEVKGTNLLTIDEQTLSNFIKEKINKDVIRAFAYYGKGDTVEQITSYLYGNVKLMQTNNKPIQNAPSRNYMPQTNLSKNWLDYMILRSS